MFGAQSPQKSISEQTAYEIDEEVRSLLNEARNKAAEIIQANRETHKLIAEALLKYETLDSTQIKSLYETGHMPEESEKDLEREAHALSYDEIKSSFSTKEEWTPEEKNRIWNYTLLDSSTNRSYGNAIFPAKRRVIISKDKGQNIAIPQFNREKKWVLKEPISMSSSFVPPCTKQVFLKYYSPTIADNNYWTKTDAEAYQNDIQECIHQLNN